MKNTQKLVASILASFVLISNTNIAIAYAKENTTLNEQSDVKMINVENHIKQDSALDIDLNSIKVDKKDVKPGDAITVSLRVSKNESNINTICLQYRSSLSDRSNQSKILYLTYNSKTNLYEGTLDIDSTMFDGNWFIDYIGFSYKNGRINTLRSSDYDFSSGTFDIHNDDLNSNTSLPSLYDIKISKKNVKPGDTVSVSLKVPGDNSNINSVCLEYKSSLSNHSKMLYLKYNSKTGLYEGTLNIDTYMSKGNWSINYIGFSYKTGNINTFRSNDYDFSNGTFNIDNENTDTTAPIVDLDSITVDKKNVNHGDTVKVSLKITDDKSGVDNVYIYYQSVYAGYSKLLTPTYNAETGLYECTIDIDDSMPQGLWSIGYMMLADKNNNTSNPSKMNTDFSKGNFYISHN